MSKGHRRPRAGVPRLCIHMPAEGIPGHLMGWTSPPSGWPLSVFGAFDKVVGDIYCSMFWTVTQVWPQQEKNHQVSWVTQIDYNHKLFLQQTLPAVFTTSAVTHMHFTHFKVILTHHLHLYGSGEIISSSVVLECHNASVIPFVGTADNANDKPGPLGISLIEAIHRVAVLESGRKILEFGTQKCRYWFNASTKIWFKLWMWHLGSWCRSDLNTMNFQYGGV